MPTFTIYVTGSNEYFYSVLNGVAMGFNDGNLVWSVVRLGALFAIITGAWHAMSKNLGSGLMRSHSWLEHAVALVLVTAIAFVPTRVVIQDIYGDQNATPVDNVPLLLAAPATVFSSVGFDSFRYIDTWFQSTTGSAMSVSENGFVTPLKLMLSIRSDMERVAPELYKSWFNYISDCTPNSTVATGLMNQSKDVANYLWVNGNESGFVDTYIAASGNQLTAAQMVTCNVAKERLASRMDLLTVSGSGPNPMSDIDRLINNNMREEKQGVTRRWTYANDFVPAFNTYALMMGNAGQSAQEYMRNSLMRNVVVDAFRCSKSNLSENAKMLCTQAQHDAIEQFKVDSAGMGTWFTNFMLPLMTMLQLFFFAYSVISLLYAVLRGAGSLSFLSKYVLFGAWVFSWLPFVAIINAFIQWMVTDKLGTLAASALTLENYTTYYEVMSKNLALASTMLASTPLLTLGLMTGSIYAFSGFAQKMSGQDYIQEKNLAPNNVDVAPVTKVATQGTRDAFLGQSTNATTLPEVGVGQALQQVAASRKEEMITNQLGTLEKFDAMVAAQRQVGGSTKVTNSDGVTAAASHQVAFQEGMNQIRNVGRQGGYDQADVATAEAQFAAKFGVGFVGGSVGAGMAKSLRGSENRAVSDLISHGINASAQYAETSGAQLASQIAKESTNSNSLTSTAAASFSEQVSQSQSSAQAYSEISSLSSGVRTDQKASVAQLGAMIKADEELGSKGGQIRQQINDQYEKLVASQGANGRELVDGAVDRKMQQWRASGAEFHNMGDIARLSVLQDFGQNAAHADIVAGMFSTATPVTSSSPTEFAGVGARAAASAPHGGYGHLNERVQGTLPGAGAGHAGPRSLAELNKDLRESNPVSDKPRSNTLPTLKKTEESLPEGTFDPTVDPRTATGRVIAQDTAKWNLANPADSKEEYAERTVKALVDQKITGVEQPLPIPGDSLLNQRREAAEASARAPSETRGNSPQDRENDVNQRLADTRQALAEDHRDVLEQNRKAAQGAGDARRERQQAEQGGRNFSPTEVALPVAVPDGHDSHGDERAPQDPSPSRQPPVGSQNAGGGQANGERVGQPGGDRTDVAGDRQLGSERQTDFRSPQREQAVASARPVTVPDGHDSHGDERAPQDPSPGRQTPVGSQNTGVGQANRERDGQPGGDRIDVAGDRQLGSERDTDHRSPQREQAVASARPVAAPDSHDSRGDERAARDSSPGRQTSGGGHNTVGDQLGGDRLAVAGDRQLGSESHTDHRSPQREQAVAVSQSAPVQLGSIPATFQPNEEEIERLSGYGLGQHLSQSAAPNSEQNVDSTPTGLQGSGVGVRLRGAPTLAGALREVGADKGSFTLAGEAVDRTGEPLARPRGSSVEASGSRDADAPLRKPVASDSGSLAGTVVGHRPAPAVGTDDQAPLAGAAEDHGRNVVEDGQAGIPPQRSVPRTRHAEVRASEKPAAPVDGARSTNPASRQISSSGAMNDASEDGVNREVDAPRRT